jgi:predicted nucleotide-binding protein (sugar kinase/HSP70/actin superfamily)
MPAAEQGGNEDMPATVGLPRSLLFHKYHVLWESFFRELGVQTITSPPSNRAILARGIELAVDETCVPVKLLLGHVDALRDKADYVLIPRIVTLARGETACVKFLGSYDVARNAIPGIRLLEYSVDVEKGLYERPELCRVGATFERNRRKVRRAYDEASRIHARHMRDLSERQETALARPGIKVLVVGHAYNLYDEMLGKPIVDFLGKNGVEVVCSEFHDTAKARKLARRISQDIPWTFNKELLGALESYRHRVDGIIFLVTFPCGPDSLMTELCMRSVKGTPSIMLVLDELQSEAGLQTRLESFIDLIVAGKQRMLMSGDAS